MNENLFASFITPTLIGLPIVLLIIIFPNLLFPSPSRLVNNPVRLTANITAGHLLIHLIGGATLVLISISPPTAILTFIILVLLTILEFAVALIQAYVFTLLVSLYLHDNT
uniref:ATP synthase F(0) complex subunit a n=1 Tax=Spermophilus dauricus TaxID=99837 RepID=A0A8C9QA84_SPEDA